MNMRRLLAATRKILQFVPMWIAAFVITSAPIVNASISPEEVPDFVKWPLYQECAAQANTESTTTAGMTITGTSAFLSGDPLSLRYPTVTDDAKFAAAMESFIKKATPSGPWAQIPNIGEELRKEAQLRNVNPMMIIVIGRHETNLGSDGGASARNNNSFGNKGDGPNGYRTWPSVKDSLIGADSFTAAVNTRISGGHPNYKNVKNMYEYLSVHISGQIIYPGDKTSVHDELMDVNVTIDNVMHYFDLAKQWIGEMTGLKIEGVPQRSAPATKAADTNADECAKNEGQDSDGTGNVNPDGYSFPLEDQTKRNYGASGPPCDKKPGCHHKGDGAPNYPAAFDLMYGGNANMNGKDVYAISDGFIVGRKEYRNVNGCYAIHFKSAKDGMYYWYGHLQNPDMSIPVADDNQNDNKPDGATKNMIKAGRKIAEVAGPQLGPVCHGRTASSEPGSHLHIDRGCVRNGQPLRGGSGDCRDPKFIDLMNNIWEKLPAK